MSLEDPGAAAALGHANGSLTIAAVALRNVLRDLPEGSYARREIARIAAACDDDRAAAERIYYAGRSAEALELQAAE